MSIFEISLVLSATLCSLVAGLLFAYAVVIMPGIKQLDDKAFIKAFQITDRIIQNNNPLFIIVWLGSAISVIICALTGFGKLEGIPLILLSSAAIMYVVGVQISTIIIHLPLNNKLQEHQVEEMTNEQLSKIRSDFEGPWNKSNQRRTLVACGVSLLLVLLALSV